LDRTVLVVEDDPALQETLEELLKTEGYAVTVAKDGLDALTKLGDSPPAVILLDVMMPRMDGYAFADELQRRGLHPGIPILILTADGRAKQKAERIGAVGYLEKPFNLVDLLQQVARFASA
jgi:two-component system, chemotaxis family, chemotaxis protein CheY